jgi:hypothetical protein
VLFISESAGMLEVLEELLLKNQIESHLIYSYS